MQPFRVASSFCWNCVSALMTAGNTAGKISLVQITATCFGMGDFLYDTFEPTMVLSFSDQIIRTF